MHAGLHCISVVTGHCHEAVEHEMALIHYKNLRHIYNHDYMNGMFSSVKAGIRSLPTDTDAFFMLPADHCAVSQKTIEELIASYALLGGSAVLYPVYNGLRGHPPLIPYRFTDGIREYGGDNGMRGYLSQFTHEEIVIDDAGMLLDMDTPRDYAHLLRYFGQPTYPDPEQCRALLNKYQTPEDILRHGTQVAELARRIAVLLEQKGLSINIDLLTAACMLHDIRREEPNHADAGGRLLMKEGYPDAALIVQTHMELPDGDEVGAEERSILYLADKLVRNGEIVPLRVTFEKMAQRFADDPAAAAKARGRLNKARAILNVLDTKYGIRFEDFSSPLSGGQ
jgi:CTP:molybdopterin cytidylyltransferase MocA